MKPTDPKTGEILMGFLEFIRGGSFGSPAPGSVRSAMRGRDSPSSRSSGIGVRLLRTE